MSDVGIGVNQIQRVTPIITGYLLGYIAAMPLLGRASDRFGRKMLMQVSLAGFALGSVITAMSTRPDSARGRPRHPGHRQRRAAAGDPGAGRRPVGARNRAAVLGGVGAAQELGSVLGPLYGITLVWLFQHWQSVFWVNVPLAVIAMVMIHFSLPARLQSEDPQKVDVRRRPAAGDRAGAGRRRPVQPEARRQAGAAQLGRAGADRGRWWPPWRSSSGRSSPGPG